MKNHTRKNRAVIRGSCMDMTPYPDKTTEKTVRCSLIYGGLPEGSLYIQTTWLYLVVIYEDQPVSLQYPGCDGQPAPFSVEASQRGGPRNVQSIRAASHDLGTLYAASVDVSVAMHYVMELLAYQQFLLGHLQGSVMPPPPPPPPREAANSSTCAQTEILCGDIDGMGDRLLLYRSRIKSLEDSTRAYQAEISRLTNSLRDMRIRESRETTKMERCIAELRRENLRLKEYATLKDTKLMECNKLIDYYKEELNNQTTL